MDMTRIRLVAASLFVLLVAAACGDSTVTTDGGAQNLDGREFWSTSVVQAGAELPFVEGTRISVRFDDGRIGASAGCNSMGGTYSISDGQLAVQDLAMTEIGCDPERHRQDEFVAGLLTLSPTVTVDGDTLTLSSGDLTVTLLDRSVADPDRSITGTRWVVTGFIQGEVATSMAVSVDGWIEFPDASTMSGFDGCSEFSGNVEVADGSVGGPVEGDGEIQFGSWETAPAPTVECEFQDYADAVNALFDTGDATYTITGPNLTIVNSDGNGVTLRAG